MHLFFAITKMGMGHVLGETVFDRLEIASPPAVGEDDWLRLDCAAALASTAGKNLCEINGNGVSKWNNVSKWFSFAVNRVSTISCLWAEVLPG
jgi:hypothetical protein